MQPTAIITWTLIVLNVIISYQGLRSESFFNRYCFSVDKILVNREYIRMVSSGFLHLNWIHLILNMISLYLFSELLELYTGSMAFVIIYFAALVGGNALALFIHRQHGDYTAAGASGAVCGVIFATIALFPGITINPLILPLQIPGWLYGLIYILYSIYGIRSRHRNVGHEAHLGGALVGMLTAMAFHPDAVAANYMTILIITVPCLAFIYLIITRPYVLYIDNFYFKQHYRNGTIDDRYNLEKVTEQNEIDDILEKIHRKGINSLTKAEKEKLDRFSK